MAKKYSSDEQKTAIDCLTDLDWNFDNVPDGELPACCYWEYARESAFIRDVRQWCAEPATKWLRNDDIERIQSIGYAAEVFLRGFFFELDIQYQSEDPEAPNYRHPNAPPITGSFPRPWQSLSQEERKARSGIRSDRTTIPLVPFKRGPAFFAKWIAEYCDAERLRTFEEHARVKRDNPHLSETGLLTRDMLKSPDVRPSLYPAGGEIGVFEIQWASFTNEELRDGFYDWIRKNRPAALPAPDGRGRKPSDWRGKLTRLAVMRLLSVFTPLKIVDPGQNQLPDVWKSKQFAARKWGDITKWHDARREAGMLFRDLLPCVPKHEKPLSWERRRVGGGI